MGNLWLFFRQFRFEILPEVFGLLSNLLHFGKVFKDLNEAEFFMPIKVSAHASFGFTKPEDLPQLVDQAAGMLHCGCLHVVLGKSLFIDKIGICVFTVFKSRIDILVDFDHLAEIWRIVQD